MRLWRLACLPMTVIIFSTLTENAICHDSGSLHNNIQEDEEEDEYTHWMKLDLSDSGISGTFKNISHWAATEELIYNAIKIRVEYVQKELDLMKRNYSFLSDYEKSSGEALNKVYEPKKTIEERAEVVASSAVLNLLMSYRFSSVTSNLRILLNSYNYKNSQEKLETVLEIKEFSPIPKKVSHGSIVLLKNGEKLNKNHTRWPGDKDYWTNMFNFLAIYDTYALYPNELGVGVAADTSFPGKLDAYQCFQIGKVALELRYYYAAIEWLEVAHAILLHEGAHGESRVDPGTVSKLLEEAIENHNEKYDAAMAYKGPYPPAPYYLNLFLNRTYPFESQNTRKRARMDWYNKNVGHNTQARYWGLCSGENYQSPETKSKLHCYYKRNHPYFQLVPLKVEELSQHPLILQMYQVLSESQIEKLKSASEGDLTTSSGVFGRNDGRSASATASYLRTSVGTWLDLESFPEIVRKAELMTDLKIWTTAESIQIANYAVGRYYQYHTDHIGSPDNVPDPPYGALHGGDRLATILYYLDVPKLGGKTAFCVPGFTTNSVKGSAILWYNTHRNGRRVEHTEHGACPVIHGTKTIASIWVRYDGNWQKHQCTLKPLD